MCVCLRGRFVRLHVGLALSPQLPSCLLGLCLVLPPSSCQLSCLRTGHPKYRRLLFDPRCACQTQTKQLRPQLLRRPSLPGRSLGTISARPGQARTRRVLPAPRSVRHQLIEPINSDLVPSIPACPQRPPRPRLSKTGNGSRSRCRRRPLRAHQRVCRPVHRRLAV